MLRKSLHRVLMRIVIVLLLSALLLGSFALLQRQNTVSPENPLSEKVSPPRIPLINAAKTQIDEEIFDLETDVSEAEQSEQEPEEPEFSEQTKEPEEQSPEQEGETKTEPDFNEPEEGAEGGPKQPADSGRPDDTGTEDSDLSDSPGSDSFVLPTDVNYFFVDIVDLKEPYTPDDPRCFYKITHIFPQLKVTNILLLNNGETVSHFGGLAAKGWLNLKSGENRISVRVTYELPNGTTKTFERAAEPSVVFLRDPQDIYIETDLKPEYDNPTISFHFETEPSDAHMQVYLKTPAGRERLLTFDENNKVRATLGKGENTIRFVATSPGWNRTELVKTVVYTESKIHVYSPELAEMDHRRGSAYVHYEKNISFSTRVEDAKSGESVAGIRMDVYLGNQLIHSLLGGDHDKIVIDGLPLGLRTITIVARGSNIQNNATEFKTVQYQILIGQGEDTPPIVREKTSPNSNIGLETIVHNPVLDFKLTPHTVDTNGEAYPLTEHKVYVYHTSKISNKTRVMMREDIMGLLCYSVYLHEGLNTIDLVLVTDELYEIDYQYKVYYIPQDLPEEPIGSIYLSIDASAIGLPMLAAGYVEIYQDEPLSYAVLELLKQHGFQVVYSGESNYAMYLQAIIKKNMLAGWDQGMISDEERARLDEAGGAGIWHGSYDINSLGIGDFTSASGWLFTLNGVSIRGLSNEFPQDGDICKMRFTLTGR